MKNIIINFICISLLTFGCNKEKEVNKDNEIEDAFGLNMGSFVGSDFDGNFIISQTDWGFSTYGINDETPFTVSSLLYSDATMTSRLNVGKMTIDTIEVMPDNLNNYSFNFNQIRSNNLLNKMGDSLSYQIAGNPSIGISPLQFKKYYPKRMNIVSPQFPNSTTNSSGFNPPSLNKNGLIELNWTPDANNLNNQIVVHIVYKPGPSQRLNSANPSSLPITEIHTDDDGSYIVDLSAIPNIDHTSHFQIWVSRYSYSGVPLGSMEYAFIQVANVYDDFILNP